MSFQPFSRLCVQRLTHLLELDSLEAFQTLEDCPYVAKNIQIEDQLPFDNIERSSNNVLKNSKSPKAQVKKIFKNISKKEMPTVFGQAVTEDTLLMIIQLIDHLKMYASTEGLFRISGNKKRQEELKTVLNQNKALHLDSEDCPYNAHDIAGVLKHFFGELPEPLLTKSCYVCYQQLAGKLKEMDSITRYKKKVETLKMLFLLLPPLNRLLLKKLVELLTVVAAQETSKMTAYNLGVIFAPNVVCTRQPMGCLSDFTENVEPFTDLVKFIIENSEEVFTIPEDFLEDGKKYINNAVTDHDVELPMSRAYCQQIDSRQFAKESKDNTHQELMMLYNQMMELPDGQLKNDFLEKFRQSYPGTPMFIPKSVKEKQRDSLPCTPQPRSKFGGCLNRPSSSSVKKAASENFLDSIDSNKDVPRSSIIDTPGRSEDNILAAFSNSNILNTTGTPGRIKKFCKRVRRRSVEIFTLKKDKDEVDDENQVSVDDSQANSSRLRSVFGGSIRKPGPSWKGLKKSVSTPSLSTRRKSSNSDSEEDLSKRKLSFSSEVDIHKMKSKPVETKDPVFDKGIVNDAFQDKENITDNLNMNPKTPVIRKVLCPSTSSAVRMRNDEKPAAANVLQSIDNTPKIMKSARNEGAVGTLKMKAKGFRMSGHFKRMTSLPSKGSPAVKQSSKDKDKGNKENSVVSTNTTKRKENICTVTTV
ncbi:rho GTPase-activating protein 19-like isoform X1 [Clytia hemisphaerica]